MPTPSPLPSPVTGSPAAEAMASGPEGRAAPLMRIGALAERSGRTERTLRFYEELGLVAPAARTKGGFRLYDEGALLRIEWISRLQDLGFSLPEVKEFLDALHARGSGPEMMGDLREFYATKLEETRSAVKRLRALEGELAMSLAYLHACKSCAPQTGISACRSCEEDEHAGQETPTLVAAVQPDPSTPTDPR